MGLLFTSRVLLCCLSYFLVCILYVNNKLVVHFVLCMKGTDCTKFGGLICIPFLIHFLFYNLINDIANTQRPQSAEGSMNDILLFHITYITNILHQNVTMSLNTTYVSAQNEPSSGVSSFSAST